MTHPSQTGLGNYRIVNSMSRGVYFSGIDFLKIERLLKNRSKVIFG